MKHICTVCGQPYEFSYEPGGKLPPNFPFCSSRCKAIDLGKWLNEEYRISMPLPHVENMTDEERKMLAQLLFETGAVDEIIDEDE